MLKIISWNMAHRAASWEFLLDTGADIALLQEAGEPPPEIESKINVDDQPWVTTGKNTQRNWRTAVVNLSGKAEVEWFVPESLENACPPEFGVSRLGTIAAAKVSTPGIEPFIVVSMYALWEKVHPVTGNTWIYADASVHRLISDFSALIGRKLKHRLLFAGDLNVLNRYGEHGDKYWGSRYSTVFDRMKALGMEFIGPQSPNGRKASPRPEELPHSSEDVPTFFMNRQNPITATRQLDFVFASSGFSKRISVKALNDPGQWGPSDHCMVEIQMSGN